MHLYLVPHTVRPHSPLSYSSFAFLSSSLSPVPLISLHQMLHARILEACSSQRRCAHSDAAATAAVAAFSLARPALSVCVCVCLSVSLSLLSLLSLPLSSSLPLSLSLSSPFSSPFSLSLSSPLLSPRSSLRDALVLQALSTCELLSAHLDAHESASKEAHLLNVTSQAAPKAAREVEEELKLQGEGDVL